MKTKLFKNLIFTVALFISVATTSQLNAQNALSGVENTKDYSSMVLIYMDKDLSVFANLLILSGLDTSLAFMNNDHTVFVPNNEAFADMSIEKFAELTNPNNRAMLVEFVNRHFTSFKIHSDELQDSSILDLDNGEKIKIWRDGNVVSVGGAVINTADIETENGVIHVMDDFINVTSW